MNTTTYLQAETHRLESAANLAIARIRQSQSVSQVIQGMSFPVPPILRSLRHLSPAVRRVRSEAHRRAESIVRAQVATLGELRDETEFLQKRGALVKEWIQLNGRFPRLATYVRVESDRRLAQIRSSNLNSRRDAPSTL
jgi:hypothetical protein